MVECFFYGAEHLILHFGNLVAAGLCLFESARKAAFHSFKVFDKEFVVDNFLVTHGVHAAVDMCYVVVVEAAQYVYYGIGLADIGKEFVAEAFAF